MVKTAIKKEKEKKGEVFDPRILNTSRTKCQIQNLHILLIVISRK